MAAEVGDALGLYWWMDFGTYPTGWYIESDLPNQVAVSTVSTAYCYTDLEVACLG